MSSPDDNVWNFVGRAMVGGDIWDDSPHGYFMLYIRPHVATNNVGAHSNLLDFYGSDIYVSYVLPLVTSG